MRNLFPGGRVAILFGLHEARSEFGLLRGKRESEGAVEKMFDAAHAGVAGFDDTDLEGYVTDKGNILLFGLVGDGEKGIARWHRNDLYEIGTALFKVIDGSAGFLGVVDGILLGSFFAARSE